MQGGTINRSGCRVAQESHGERCPLRCAKMLRWRQSAVQNMVVRIRTKIMCVSCIHRARQRNADNVLVCGWRFSHHSALRWKFSSVNCADRPPNAGSSSSARRGAHSYPPGLRFFRLFHHVLRNRKTTSVGHRAMRHHAICPHDFRFAVPSCSISALWCCVWCVQI